jgi:hypothetical protein
MTSVTIPTLFSSTSGQYNTLPQNALQYCVLFGKNVESQITRLTGLTIIGSAGSPPWSQNSNNATVQNDSQLSTMVTNGNTFHIGNSNTVIGNIGFPLTASATQTTTSGTENVVIVATQANFSQPFQNNMVLISTKSQFDLSAEISDNVVKINTSALVLPGLRDYNTGVWTNYKAIMVDRKTGRLVKTK